MPCLRSAVVSAGMTTGSRVSPDWWPLTLRHASQDDALGNSDVDAREGGEPLSRSSDLPLGPSPRCHRLSPRTA
jgi:hypothetical protein